MEIQGKFFGIGVGPGDPELLTLKALRLLKESDIIFVPVSRRGSKSRAYQIVSQAIPNPPLVEELLFPMTEDSIVLKKHWEKGGERVALEINQGKKVSFITLGDPLLYSTFSYLLKEVKEKSKNLDFTIVPGIPSFTAAAATLGIPLTEGEEPLALLPSFKKREELLKALEEFDTVIILKISKNFSLLIDTLEEKELLEKSYLISNCGTKEEEIVTDLLSLRGKKIPYLSLVIVRRKQ